MGLVDYISRNPYQPAKSISKYDDEFLIATLSSIHNNAKLLQQKHNISANTLIKLFHENKCEVHTDQLLSIGFANPKLLTTDNRSTTLQSHSTKPLLVLNK